MCCVCVVCMRCGVCCVCGAAWHAENPRVCGFKTTPCVPAKRAHVFNMRAFCRFARKPFEPQSALFVHTALTCASVSVRGIPGITVQASCHLE